MSYKQHGWRHHPTKGTDPIPLASAAGTSLPYVMIAQTFTNYNTTGKTQFRLTSKYLEYTNDNTTFTFEDSDTSLGINVEGIYVVKPSAGISTTGITTNRNVWYELWNGSSWDQYSGADVMPAYIAGQPTLTSTQAANFEPFRSLWDHSFVVMTLDDTGAPSLPIKIRPVLAVDATVPNPMSFGVQLEAVRIGDAGAYF